ncbi:MAG: undecaprenyl-diphosphate phosphatase [Bdellovibrionales bacterium]|nr:undecaprenyl-diphosphate phosphatase [Bdellovibrionales bacterium]
MSSMHAIVLAIVEGLTEYLPVSSTGHIILASWFMGIHEDAFVKDYTVMVQFGAILAVLVLYWRRFLLNFKIYPKVFVAFLPAAVIGLAIKNHVEKLIGNVTMVGIALLVGGVLLVLTDRWVRRLKVRVTRTEDLPLKSAFQIGLFQCLAMIPGTSRSAATIWGGLYQGMSLPLATEFSFFLAVPTLMGAGFLELRKVWPTLTSEQIDSLLWGNLISFVVGALTIRFFMHLVSRVGLRHFGYYRIVVGLLVLILIYSGAELQIV